MSRKLVAALACRVNGKRLYGKPLQNLATDYSILDQIVAQLRTLPQIEEIVLGISEGVENLIFIDYAKKHGLKYIIGDEVDVLHRLILCGQSVQATDVFRITTECPFIWLEDFDNVWETHCQENHDVTVTDFLPEGTAFEIYKLDALLTSHRLGASHHRSEGCSRYIREHRDEFSVGVIKPSENLQRLDIRLTVDYPEDLVLCRKIYEALADQKPCISLDDIIAFCDEHQDLLALVKPYVYDKLLWA